MANSRNRTHWLVAACSVAVVVMILLGRGRQDTTSEIAYVDQWPEDEATVVLLLDFADDIGDDERQSLLAELPEGFALNSVYSEAEGLYRLRLPTSQAIALAERWESDERIEFIEPEYQYSAFGAPNDPYYPFQWNLDQIDVETGWDRSVGEGVVVAVIDTGVAYGNDEEGRFKPVRDLSHFVPGYDFVDDDELPFDQHGHGTHVAGTVGQTTNNDYGVASVAPQTDIMPVRVLNAQGFGKTADIADAIRFATDHGADVINMSLGGPAPSEIMADAVRYAHDHGVVVIAAAGNSGWSRRSYPAAYEHVIGVAATQYDQTTTFYSNYGSYIDIAAPGGNTNVDQNDDGQPDGIMQETIVRETPLEHEFALYMGTSMACPHVAGAAALIIGMGVSHPDRVEEILLSTANQDVEQYKQDRYGAGILDTGAATAFPLAHYQLPRAALAFLVSLLMLSSMGGRSLTRPLSSKWLFGSVLLGATGLALIVFPMSVFGLSVGVFAPLSTNLLNWPAAIGLSGLAHNALWLSAIPIIGLYAVFGGVANRRIAAVVIGLMVGLSVALIGETFVTLNDVSWVPGTGLLDRVWLACHGTIGLGVTVLALRKD